MANPVRVELVKKLGVYAESKSLPLSVQGKRFSKPESSFLECFLIGRKIKNPTTDAIRKREYGTFQINIWQKEADANGTSFLEDTALELSNLYPVYPKTGVVSIEDPADLGNIITDVAGWLILPVTISYRYES